MTARSSPYIHIIRIYRVDVVAWQATFLCSEQVLVKGEQGFIYFKDVVVSVPDEILNDDIKFI